MLKNTQCTCITPCRVSHKFFGFYNISFETCKGRIAIPKPRRKAILTSYCDNILNHETKGFINKKIPCSIYHALHIDSNKWKYCKVGHIDGRRTWANLKSLNAIPTLCCDNSLTMKYKNFFKYFIPPTLPPPYHEVHVFQIICSSYNMI